MLSLSEEDVNVTPAVTDEPVPSLTAAAISTAAVAAVPPLAASHDQTSAPVPQLLPPPSAPLHTASPPSPVHLEAKTKTRMQAKTKQAEKSPAAAATAAAAAGVSALPRYLKPTAAVVARRNSAQGNTTTKRESVSAAAVSSRRTGSAQPATKRSPSSGAAAAAAVESLVDDVLTEQLNGQQPATIRAAVLSGCQNKDSDTTSAAQSPLPTVEDVTPPLPSALRRKPGSTQQLSRQRRTVSIAQPAATSSARRDGDDDVLAHSNPNVLGDDDMSEENDEDDGEVLHSSLRLQPFPATIPASSQVAAAMADVLGAAGVDSVMTDALLQPTPTGRTSFSTQAMSAAQAALAAGRASLLEDSPNNDPPLTLDSNVQDSAAGKRRLTATDTTTLSRKTMMGHAGDARRTLLPSSSSSPCTGVATARASVLDTAITPAEVAEFLRLEAAAEAAEAERTKSRPPTQPQDEMKSGVDVDADGFVAAEASPSRNPQRQGETQTLVKAKQRGSAARDRSSSSGGRGGGGGGALSSTQTDSAAVLRELQSMQQRICTAQRVGRHGTPTRATAGSSAVEHGIMDSNASGTLSTTPASPAARVSAERSDGGKSKGYASSPCDVSAAPDTSTSSPSEESASDSSSTLLSSSPLLSSAAAPLGAQPGTLLSESHRASRNQRGGRQKRSSPRKLRLDWSSATLTEIVDALDSNAAPLVLSRQSAHKAGSGGGRTGKRKRRSRSILHFDPAVYAQELLEGRVDDSDSAAEDDGDDVSNQVAKLFSASDMACPGAAKDCSPDMHTVQTDAASTAHGENSCVGAATFSDQSPQRFRNSAALVPGGSSSSSSSWAAAAAEAGMTTAEVKELLMYSLNAPQAAAWLSTQMNAQHAPDVTSSSPPCGADAHGEYRRDPTNSSNAAAAVDGQPHQQKQSRRPVSYALDAATQSALVHRILTALPAVPGELRQELAQQRKLLEKVCREVSVATAPLHAAAHERATSPTLNSALRQPPPWIELDTSQPRSRGNGAVIVGGGASNPLLNSAYPHVQGTRSAAGAAQVDATVTEEERAERLHEAQMFASLPRPAAKALAAAASLHHIAADPTRPLPLFHSIVAQPHPSRPSHTRGAGQHADGLTSPDAAAAAMMASTTMPYEAALHELAERETAHYTREIDRLRSTYDRQLQQERRQYAALLDSQQQRMLRHHRETIHLLQRDARLQQQQSEAMVQQLASAQSAASLRQQAEHERTTRHMLAGAVDVMTSRCVSAAEMDAVAGVQQRRGSSSPYASAAARSALARTERIRQRSRSRNRTSTKTAARTTAETLQGEAADTPAAQTSSPAAKAVEEPAGGAAEESNGAEPRLTTAAANDPKDTRRPPPPPAAAETKKKGTSPPVAVRTAEPEAALSSTSTATASADTAAVATQGDTNKSGEVPDPFDADIPTAGHLTSLAESSTPPAAASPSSSSSTASGTALASSQTTTGTMEGTSHQPREENNNKDDEHGDDVGDAVRHYTPQAQRKEKQREESALSASVEARRPSPEKKPVSHRHTSAESQPPRHTAAATEDTRTRAPPSPARHRVPRATRTTTPPPSPTRATTSGAAAAATPSLQLNTAEGLRAIYGAALDETRPNTTTSSGNGRVEQQTSMASSSPQQHRSRMVLPLQVQLPPEDEYDVYVRRVEAATATVEARAAEAAQKAGLAEGTKLYTVGGKRAARHAAAEAEESKRRRATPAVSSPGGLARGGGVASSAHRKASAYRSGSRRRLRSRTHRSRGGVGGGSVFRSHQTSPLTSPPAHSFDVEVVSVLSSDGHHDGKHHAAAARRFGSDTSGTAQQRFAASPADGFRGEWGERMAVPPGGAWRGHTHDTFEAAPASEWTAQAGVIAGRPSVGSPLLVLADPLAGTIRGHSSARDGAAVHSADATAAAAEAAAAFVLGQPVGHAVAITSQLRHADSERARRIAELRDAATATAAAETPTTTPAPSSRATDASQAASLIAADHSEIDGVSTRADSAAPPAFHRVGELPPCDAAFFGAPAEVLFSDKDSHRAVASAPRHDARTKGFELHTSTAAKTTDDYSHRNGDGRDGGESDWRVPASDTAFYETSRNDADVRTPSDYARAWRRYERAAQDVETAAAALAAEDAGVLDAAARAHSQQRGLPFPPPQQQTLPHVASSTAAGVRYRELQLGYGHASTERGTDHAQRLPSASSASSSARGVFVSERMADEARALTVARQRLAKIRDCFVSPPLLFSDDGAAAAAVPSSACNASALQDAARLRRLVDETVMWSVLETQQQAQHDPVRQVVAAMEHELLRLMLEDEICGGTRQQAESCSHKSVATTTTAARAASPSPSSSSASPLSGNTNGGAALDRELLLALAEAALEDAVMSTLLEKKRKGTEETQDTDSLPAAKSKDHETAVLTRALERYAAQRTTASADAPVGKGETESVPREHIRLPEDASTAWLHDPVTPSPAVAAGTAAVGDREVRQAEAESDSQPVSTRVVHVQDNSSQLASLASATVVIPVPSHQQSQQPAGSVTPSHEVRIVLDLSPVARHLLSPATNGGRSSYPPIQQEDVPSRHLALEDRRDVIVESELRLPAREATPTATASTATRAARSLLVGERETAQLCDGEGMEEPPQQSTPLVASDVHEEGEVMSTTAASATGLALPLPPTTTAAAGLSEGLPMPTPVPPVLRQQQQQQQQLQLPGGHYTAVTATPLPVAALEVSLPFAAAVRGSPVEDLPAALPSMPHPAATQSGPLPFSTLHLSDMSCALPSADQHATAVLFRVLVSTLLGQEKLQREGMQDREDEQRNSIRLLCTMNRESILKQQQQQTAAAVVGGGVSRSETQMSQADIKKKKLPEPPSFSSRAVAADTVTAESARPSAPLPQLQPLPRVRDPVMSAVLEWVYQFGHSQPTIQQQQYRRQQQQQEQEGDAAGARSSVSRSAPLVAGLQSAAETAAVWSSDAQRRDEHGGVSGVVSDRYHHHYHHGELPHRDDAGQHPFPEPTAAAAAAVWSRRDSRSPMVAHAASSQPSTRNLGSDTSATSSVSSVSNSLPSSLHTNSTSTSASGAQQRGGSSDVRWQSRVVRAEVKPLHGASRRRRPLLDVQHRTASYATQGEGDTVRQLRAALGSQGPPSDTATTRYTTSSGTFSVPGGRGTEDNTRAAAAEEGDEERTSGLMGMERVGESRQPNAQHPLPQLRPSGDDDGNGVGRRDVLSSPALLSSSHLLPRGVSAEVQAALDAAVRAHHRATLLDHEHAETEYGDGVYRHGYAGGGRDEGEAAAAAPPRWVEEDSQYAVTLPARSAEATQLRSTPPRRLPTVETPDHNTTEKRRATRSPTRSSAAAAAAVAANGIGAVVLADDGRRASPVATPPHQQQPSERRRQPGAAVEIHQWAAYSLTSASTSSHDSSGGEGRDKRKQHARTQEDQPAPLVFASASAATAAVEPAVAAHRSDLPFLEAGRNASSGIAALPTRSLPSGLPLLSPPPEIMPAASRNTVANVPSDTPFTYATLRDEVRRVQDEYRGGVTARTEPRAS